MAEKQSYNIWYMGWRVAGRMAIYHLCFLVFGALVFMTAAGLDHYDAPEGTTPINTNLMIVTLLFLVLYIYLAYQTVWPWGQRDYNKVKHERTRFHPYKGLLVGLVASIPGLLLILLTFALSTWLPNHNISNISYLVLSLYYIVFYSLRAITHYPLIYLLALTVLPIASQVAFRFGYRSYNPLHEIFYRKK
ncbi:MAG: hypothetical protein FWE06_09890 [Oscillospiraceae bacterium]|nr:hypothetical protein [Oscillospiraceae bacterium]